eukprot:TRINITY_DN1828_c0_g1_i1.p1 TRINITY_DN1828_c0_g1~~TRINITY_DN1828_c0_g1_i1.p1  ORF type:complete len:155 (+),score=30.19 TRINITY_DN1828_c0_g1_i1:32-496(+)
MTSVFKRVEYEISVDDMSSSFPSDLGYGEELPIDNSIKIDENIPRILLTGPKSSGKSSIQKVVFHKMAPVDTLFLEPTSDIIKNDVNHSTLVNFQIWDAPGDLDFQDPTMAADQIFQGCGALIYVINAQVGLSLLLKTQKTSVFLHTRMTIKRA